ncbi:MAG: Rab family GTPase [Rhodocyclaceae bacterium]|nr:MAG: Rab family GTPase [Rhodocyclaceae bacterium]
MTRATIYTRTDKGEQTAASESRELANDLRKALDAIDGISSVDALLHKLNFRDAAWLDRALAALVTKDLIREAESSEGALDFTAPPPIDDSKRKAEEKVRHEAEQKVRHEAEQKARHEAEQKARHEAEVKAKHEAEQKAKHEAEQKARHEAEQKAKHEVEAKARHEAEQKARHEAEQKARQEAEQKARHEAAEKAKHEAEAKARHEAEQKAKHEAEEKAKREAEAKARHEAAEKAKHEAEAKARHEVEEKAKREAEEQELKLAAERVRLKAAERARQDAEEQARKLEEQELKLATERVRSKAAEHARKDAEVQAQKLAEEQALRETAERARLEAEAQTRKLAEEQTLREAAERARREAEEKAQRMAEELARRDAEEKARREAEEKARREAEEKTRRDAEEKARREAEEKARREAEEKARRETEEKVRRDAEAKARQEAEAKARREAEDKARREAEEKARQEAEEKARQEAEEKARQEAEEKARQEAEEKARQEAEEKVRQEAEEKARREAEEKARRDAEEKQQRDAEEVARREDAERPRQEVEAQERMAVEEKAWREAEEKFRREEQEAAAKRGKRAAAKEVNAGAAKPSKRAQQLAIGITALLLVGLVAIHLISFDGQIPQFEKSLAAQFQQPVKIQALRLSLVPQRHVRLEGVSIGSEGQIKILQIKATGALGNLFADKKAFSSVELDSPVITEEGLGWLLFGKPSAGGTVFGPVSVLNATLQSKNVSFPAFDAKLQPDGEGAWKTIAIESADKNLNLELTPKGESVQADFKARSFRIPFGSNLTLDDLVVSGTADRTGLSVTEFKAFAHGGILGGSARLTWGTQWNLSGKLNAKQVDASRLVPGLVDGGRLVGAATYAMQAPDAAGLFAANRLEGEFIVSRGTLLGVDLGRMLQGGGMSGETRFSELAADVVHDRGTTQLRQVRLTEGALSANGTAEVDVNSNVRGRFAVELRMSGGQRRANLAVVGTLKKIEWRRQ